MFTPDLLKYLQWVISDEAGSPRLHVIHVTSNLETLAIRPQAYMEFEVLLFNGSMFALRFDGTIEGRVAFPRPRISK
jgi:hypothetical protein